MSVTTPRVYAVQYSFSNFLWKRLDLIYAARDRGDYVDALTKAMELYDCLPVEVKKRLENEFKEIEKEFNRPFRKPQDFFVRLVVSNRTRQARAKTLVSRYLRRLIEELDKRGYLEKRGRSVETNVPSRLFAESLP